MEDGKTSLEYCPTEDMLADGLTKALGPERHKKLVKMMGMNTWESNDITNLRESPKIRSGSNAGTSSPVLSPDDDALK